MKSNKQKRLELQAKRQRREKKAVAYSTVPVNPVALRPDNSYGAPLFVTRGFYVDQPFSCRDCGKAEVWTATQQKWWYEVAKGEVWTNAIRCRACRRRERERQTEARRVHLEGVAKKRQARQTLTDTHHTA
jgi:Probable zinc-ribbon domain